MLHTLADLELKQIAMANVLDTRITPEDQHHLWRPKVRSLQEHETLKASARAKYADIEQTFLLATDDCPEALSLLLPIAKGLV